MFSLRHPIYRLVYFTFLTISFSSCTSSCECKQETLPCSVLQQEKLEIINSFENDTILFVGSSGLKVSLIYSKLDSSIYNKSYCRTGELGGCSCGDCSSSYNLNLLLIDSTKTKKGSIFLNFKQNFVIVGGTHSMSDVSSNLRINIGDVYGAIKLPLVESSLENSHDYIEEISLHGKKFKKAFRLFSIRNINGEMKEKPGSIYYTRFEGIVGFIDPSNNELFVVE